MVCKLSLRSIYNQIMLNFTGYSEGALYLSQWTLYLACIVLPLSGIGWKKSPFALIFSAVCIFAVASIIPEGNLSLYADGVLAFFFGSLVLAWYLEKDKSAKRYIWAGAGLFMLVQIKSGTGLSLSVMFMAFAIFSDAVLNKYELPAKKVYIKNLITIAVLAQLYIYPTTYTVHLRITIWAHPACAPHSPKRFCHQLCLQSLQCFLL